MSDPTSRYSRADPPSSTKDTVIATPLQAFITGVTGQDGSYLSRSLLEQGYDVVGLVRPGLVDHPGTDSRVQLLEGDLRDTDRLRELVLATRPNEIYNLAGQSSVAASWADPVEAVRLSGTAVAALLNGAKDLHDSGHSVRFVQASSAEIFGSATLSPQSELTPIAPVSPYGAAKALGHFLVGAFRSEGVHASSCIMYNHESPKRPKSFVARKITSTVARISRGLEDQLVLGNLDVTRDWGWAPDYVRALQLAIRHPEPTDFIIGTGQGHTVRAFVTEAFAAVGISDWETYVHTDPAFMRPVDPNVQLADASKAERLLGWTPTVHFTELVERMVRADLELIDAEQA